MQEDHNFIPSIDYHLFKENFLQTLQKSAHGEKTSLAFLKYHFPKDPVITPDQDRIVQAIVIGGTNFEVALVHMNHGMQTILERQKGSLPQLNTITDFQNIINTFLYEKATAIALNFAFPVQATIGLHGELEGILVRGTKSHYLTGLVGKPVGLEVKNIFKQKYKKEIPVTVANDVICLIESDGALVVATGSNIGLRLQEGEYVNLESGAFSEFVVPAEIEHIDRLFNTPGRARFEKLVSGKYLPARFNILNKMHNLGLPDLEKCEELDALAIENTSVAGNLSRGLLEQSASLIAAQLAALYEFKNRPDRMSFNAEGSVIRKAWKYEENLMKRLHMLDIPQEALELVHHQDSSIKGAISLLTRRS
jgi:hexokinase